VGRSTDSHGLRAVINYKFFDYLLTSKLYRHIFRNKITILEGKNLLLSLKLYSGTGSKILIADPDPANNSGSYWSRVRIQDTAQEAVLRIPIRKDPHHFDGSGSAPKPMDPDPDADPTLFHTKLRKDVLQMN